MLPEECFARVEPTPPKKTFLIHANEDVAKKSDFTVADILFEIAINPYAEHKQYERWGGPTPDEFKNKKLSCSS